jgi:hypothetical protein
MTRRDDRVAQQQILALDGGRVIVNRHVRNQKSQQVYNDR